MTYDTINDAVTIPGNGEGTLLANRYRVVRQLGQGGMGSVWLAEDTQLDNKPFAIKMLPAILVSNKRAYSQLKDEALVAMKLTHPNIVTLRAFEENNGNPFLVMDYVEGETLDDYLAEHGGGVLTQRHRDTEAQSGRARSPSGPPGGLPESAVLRILRPIAAALDYAHGEGVVHRDVKPANVMIRKDGHPFILDFGIAREIQETMTRVTGKLSSGTLLYMSPEQLMGEPPKPEQDIYSFAAMAYECLKGEPPFVRGAIEDQIKNKQPDPPPGGTQLVASVMAGLAKKPEDRPHTCAAVLEGKDFSRVERVDRVDGVGGARRPAEPGGSRSRATVKGIIAAALLAALAGGAWWFVNARAARSTGTTGVPPVATNARNSERRAKWHKEGEEFTINDPYGLNMTMKWCPAGSFTMGSPMSEEGRFDDEKQHEVTLTKGFWMGQTEVTQGQWKKIMGGETVVDLARKGLQDDTMYNIGGKQQTLREFWGMSRDGDPMGRCGDLKDDVPVYNVSWNEAVEFCRRLTQRERAEGRIPDGYEYRLPTEAEWEYACRAGTTSALPNGRDIRILGENNAPALDDIAWYGGNSSVGFNGRGVDTSNWPEKQYPGGRVYSREVKGKQPNRWGLYDMIGNVWEWCGDWYGDYPYGSATDPTGAAEGACRVLRGGGWHDLARYCRSAHRAGFEPGYRFNFLGFRVALAPSH